MGLGCVGFSNVSPICPFPGGAVIDSGRFDWTSGDFPSLTEPEPAYHGLKFAETFGDLA